jgi:hypothetical protein
MTDPLSQTILIGGALILCGYILGRGDGWKRGSDQVMQELITSKLIDPVDVLRHYANVGNVRAQRALEKLNLERKEKFRSKTDAED